MLFPSPTSPTTCVQNCGVFFIKFSLRFIGPCTIVGHSSPNVYQVSFGDKHTNSHRHANIEGLSSGIQPCATCGLCAGIEDLLPIGLHKTKTVRPWSATSVHEAARAQPEHPLKL
jgi:hypothetical protein